MRPLWRSVEGLALGAKGFILRPMSKVAPASPKSNLETMRELIAKEDWTTAFRIASSFKNLGAQKARITRAWEVIQRPDFYRQIRKDPEAIIADGIAALRERFAEKPNG